MFYSAKLQQSSVCCSLSRRCLVLSTIISIFARRGEGRIGGFWGNKNTLDNFLYLGRNDSSPIIDYEGTNDPDENHPAFLYSASMGPRVVEFYAPWCPHCQHFRTEYINYGQRVTDVMATANVDKKEWVQFYAVSCSAHNKICNSFRVSSYPAVKVFGKGSAQPVADIFPHLLSPFELLVTVNITNDALVEKYGPISSLDSKEKLRLVRNQIHYGPIKESTFDDAYLSFDYAMRKVFTTPTIHDDKVHSVLKDWLLLLKGTMPRPSKMERAVNALLNVFDNPREREKEFIKILDQIRATSRKKWSSSCSKGRPSEGYTCGLWKLIHMMSIGVLELNHERDTDTEALEVSAKSAVDILRDFIDYFLDCQSCRSSFLKAYDGCESNMCDRLTRDRTMSSLRQLPLWLFELHNSLNIQLVRERAEQEERVLTGDDQRNALWPSQDECPKCWKDGEFDADLVLKHLRLEYWLEDQVAANYRDEMQENYFVEKAPGLVDAALQMPPILLFGIFAFVVASFWVLKACLCRRAKSRRLHSE